MAMIRLAGWIAFGVCSLCFLLWAADRIEGIDGWWDMQAKIVDIVPTDAAHTRQLSCARAVKTVPEDGSIVVELCGKRYRTKEENTNRYEVGDTVTVVVYAGRITGRIYSVEWIRSAGRRLPQ